MSDVTQIFHFVGLAMILAGFGMRWFDNGLSRDRKS